MTDGTRRALLKRLLPAAFIAWMVWDAMTRAWGQNWPDDLGLGICFTLCVIWMFWPVWPYIISHIGRARFSLQHRQIALAPCVGPGEWIPGQRLSAFSNGLIAKELGSGATGKVYLIKDLKGQYVVKRARIRDGLSQRSLLSEIQIWLAIPSYRHLAGLRSFCLWDACDEHTELLLAAEYVGGGTLDQLIQSRRLYRGGSRKALGRILDIAIQSAWGLNALHISGLVHQDFKPSNVLMTCDGTVKITDFGLTRACGPLPVSPAENTPQDIMVTVMGMTPAYCSPEQADAEWGKNAGLPEDSPCKKLTAATDIWSWGVSILEMFTGGVTWISGVAAPEVLKNLLAAEDIDQGLQKMPSAIARVLEKCFHDVPSERWGSITEAADALVDAYHEVLQKDYPRRREQPKSIQVRKCPITEKLSESLFQTGSVYEQVAKAFEVAGRKLEQIEYPCPATAFCDTYTVDALADWITCLDARNILEDLIADGDRQYEVELAEICEHEALLCSLLMGYKRGAQHLYAVAAHLRENSNTIKRRVDARLNDEKLAQDFESMASLSSDAGQVVNTFGRAIHLYDALDTKKAMKTRARRAQRIIDLCLDLAKANSAASAFYLLSWHDLIHGHEKALGFLELVNILGIGDDVEARARLLRGITAVNPSYDLASRRTDRRLGVARYWVKTGDVMRTDCWRIVELLRNGGNIELAETLESDASTVLGFSDFTKEDLKSLPMWVAIQGDFFVRVSSETTLIQLEHN